MLSKADSNHHRQYQKLQCYHYTIGQSSKRFSVKSAQM